MSGSIPSDLESSERVYLSAKIFGRTHFCLLDSGSEVTLIPTSLIGNREIQGTMRQTWAVNGSQFRLRAGFLSPPTSTESK